MTTTEFDAWAETLGLQFIKPHELRTKCDNPRNELPPRELFGNIVLTAHLVDRLRAHFSKPVALHSTYRSPAYNRGVGGARHSMHLVFRAIDFSIFGVRPAEAAGKLMEWRDAGLWHGGIGVYPSFVHVDTRGYNASW